MKPERKTLLTGVPRRGELLPNLCTFATWERRPDGDIFWYGIYHAPTRPYRAVHDGETIGYTAMEKRQIGRKLYDALIEEHS